MGRLNGVVPEDGARMGTVVKAALTVALVMALTPTQAASAKPPPPTHDPTNCARAGTTHFEYVVPKYKPSGPDDMFETFDGTARDEVVAYACLERKGRNVTMHYGWSSRGRIHVAGFSFRLMDCATEKSLPETIRTMTYPRGTELRSADDSASFTLPKSRSLRPHLYGAGEYSRNNGGYDFEGSVGRFNTWEEPKFVADGVCR